MPATLCIQERQLHTPRYYTPGDIGPPSSLTVETRSTSLSDAGTPLVSDAMALVPQQPLVAQREVLPPRKKPKPPPKQDCTLMTIRPRLQPPGPSPLLFLSVQVGDTLCWALLDSGAADNFVAKSIVKALGLTPK